MPADSNASMLMVADRNNKRFEGKEELRRIVSTPSGMHYQAVTVAGSFSELDLPGDQAMFAGYPRERHRRDLQFKFTMVHSLIWEPCSYDGGPG